MRDHRSLFAWQEARGVVLGVVELASLSVQLNIAEAYAYGESPSYTRHLAIAYGSAVETGELLEVAIDARVVAVEVGNYLLNRNRRSQRLLLGMLRRRKPAHRSRSS